MNRLGVLCVLAVLLWNGIPAGSVPLDPYRRLDPAVTTRALSLSRTAARYYLEHRSALPLPPDLPPQLLRPAGAFVTILKDGKTRGCWGSVSPRHGSLAAEIVAATVGAMYRDGRWRPVNREEWPALSFSISVVGPLVPVHGPAELQPGHYGLLVTDGGRGGVLLPGEARTSRWQIAECRRKAGLSPTAPAQMYRFETVVLGPFPAARLP